MNFKERKARIEQDVVSSVKGAVNEEVVVKANYNLEQGTMEVAMSQTHKNPKTDNINNVVYYQVSYNEETQAIGIYAFSRVYHYDSLSVVAVINEPVVVEEKFMMDMKEIIQMGMTLIDQPAKESTEPTDTEAE